MIITKLYISEKQNDKKCGFESIVTKSVTFDEGQVWIKDSDIMTIAEIRLDVSKELEKKVLEYVNERNKILVSVTLENGSTINNVIVNNLIEVIPRPD